jgi:hypothetical protein
MHPTRRWLCGRDNCSLLADLEGRHLYESVCKGFGEHSAATHYQTGGPRADQRITDIVVLITRKGLPRQGGQTLIWE